MMNYGQLLSQSWKIVRRHKFLWLLGMMAGLLTFASSYNTGHLDMGGSWLSGYSFQVNPFGGFLLKQLPSETSVVNLLVVFLLWVIELAARAGLIYAAAALDQGESMGFGSAFRRGLGKVGRLIGLKIVLSFASFILFVLMSIVMMFIVMAISQAFEISPELFIPIIVITWFIFVIALQFVDAFAFRAVVLHDLSIIASIKRGWLILREKLGECLALGMIFVPFYIAISIVIWPLFAPLVFSMDFLTIVVILLVAVAFQYVFFPFQSTALAYLVAVAFQSLFVPFQSTAVTLTYLQLVGERGAQGGAQGG